MPYSVRFDRSQEPDYADLLVPYEEFDSWNDERSTKL